MKILLFKEHSNCMFVEILLLLFLNLECSIFSLPFVLNEKVLRFLKFDL